MVESKQGRGTIVKPESKGLTDLVNQMAKNGKSDLVPTNKKEEPESNEPVRATDAQVYAAKLSNERRLRINLMNHCAQLERKLAQKTIEVGNLINELATTRQEVNSMVVSRIDEDNTLMFKRVGLKEGDRVTDTLEGKDGWHVVQNK